MPILEFLADSEWDAPIFKCLAGNDTGQASGHQAGMVYPKTLRQFLPDLSTTEISIVRPTVDRRLYAELYIGLSFIQSGTVRYQLQTWRGTRSPESRITDGLRPIHSQAEAGDLIIFQRHIESLDRYRIILVKQSSAEYSLVETLVGNRRWGCLYEDLEPITQSALQIAHHDLDIAISLPFVGITPEVVRHETRITKISRSAVFREIVRREYNYRCAVTGIEIATPNSLYEVQAVHIIPVSERGQDDPRNGLSLCQTMHWAFDHGLFGINPNTHTVVIPRRIRTNIRNEYILQFEDREITEATGELYRVHEDALTWHYENKVRQWE